jgi:hypothetical protein
MAMILIQPHHGKAFRRTLFPKIDRLAVPGGVRRGRC